MIRKINSIQFIYKGNLEIAESTKNRIMEEWKKIKEDLKIYKRSLFKFKWFFCSF